MKRFKIWVIITIVALAMASIISVYCTNMQPAYARASSVELVRKAQKQGVKECYNNNIVRDDVETYKTTASPNTLRLKDVVLNSNTIQVLLPYNLTNIIDNNINCYELFFGYNNRDTIGYNIFRAGGSIIGLESSTAGSEEAATANIDSGILTNPSAVRSLLKSLGYTGGPDSNGNNASYNNCVSISLTYHRFGDLSTDFKNASNVICFDFSSGGAALSKDKSGLGVYIGEALEIMQTDEAGKIVRICQYGSIVANCTDELDLSKITKISNMPTFLSQQITGKFSYDQSKGGDVFYIKDITATDNVQTSDAESGTYKRPKSLSEMFKAIFGDSSTDTDYNYSELYDLYVNYYLRDSYKATIACVDPGDTDALQIAQASVGTGTGQYRQVTLYYNGEMNENCFAKTSEPTTLKNMYVAAGTNNGSRYLKTAVNFDGLISAINTLAQNAPGGLKSLLATAAIPGVESDPNISTDFKDQDNQINNPTINDGDPGILDGCMSNAGVLGWILCPVIRFIGEAIEGVYSGVEGFLMIDASTVTDNATRDAWSQFQGFANIVFAIVLAIVILSQVTGIGVSNYNVKKILPRLIITIVLVNLSFILCSLAIDLSNILGVRLKEMFDAFKVINEGAFDVDPGAFAKNTLQSLLTVGPIALGTGVAISVVMTAELWKMMILPLLLGFIAMLVSIFFFFLILGARQAAIIILLVVSPLAIICYTLPNTQKIFDRWMKMFSSLLLVYPICGLLMGGGQFMSRLLLNAGGKDMSFMYYLTAMLLSVVPFFFIPSILKSSFAAMGNLGLKLSQMGSRVGGGITRSIRGSEWARDYQREHLLSQSRGAYERLERREAALKAKGKTLSARQGRAKSRYAKQMLRLEAEDRRAGYGSDQVAAARRRQLTQQEEDDINGRQELFTSGSMRGIASGQVGDVINGNDNEALGKELDAYMDQIITGTGSEDEIHSAVMNAQAIIGALSDQGTGAARSVVEQSFAKAMNGHQAILNDASQKDRLTNTFGRLAARTNSKYGKDYKKDSPGTTSMLGDIAQGNFSRAGSFVPAGGGRLRSTHYSGAGISGMNTEDFSKIKGYGARNILEGIRRGDITGTDARAASRMADEVLNSDVYSPESDVRDVMEQIRAASYSAGGNINGRTAGSLSLSSASSSALESMYGGISNIADATAWNGLSQAERDNYRQLFNNARESLNNDTLSAENAAYLQNTLKLAHDRGFTEREGAPDIVQEFSGTPNLKVDHSKTIQVPPVPAGWTPSGQWTGRGMPSKAEEIAYQEWAKIKAQADMQK